MLCRPRDRIEARRGGIIRPTAPSPPAALAGGAKVRVLARLGSLPSASAPAPRWLRESGSGRSCVPPSAAFEALRVCIHKRCTNVKVEPSGSVEFPRHLPQPARVHEILYVSPTVEAVSQIMFGLLRAAFHMRLMLRRPRKYATEVPPSRNRRRQHRGEA